MDTTHRKQRLIPWSDLESDVGTQHRTLTRPGNKLIDTEVCLDLRAILECRALGLPADLDQRTHLGWASQDVAKIQRNALATEVL